MSFSLNKYSAIGNLGKDAEIREVAGKKVANFSIGIAESYKGKDGNWVNTTLWMPVTLWEPTEFNQKALTKGSKFYISGKLVKREYEKDGVKKQIVEITIYDQIHDLVPLDSKKQETNNSQEEPDAPF